MQGIAFLEYADTEATKIAVEGLNGMDIGENKLKTSLASIGIKQAMGMEMGAQAMSAFAGTQATEGQEGRVVQLLNMVTAEELIDNDEYEGKHDLKSVQEVVLILVQKFSKIFRKNARSTARYWQ